MAEVLEYSFVILASTLVVLFSVGTYQSLSGTVAEAGFHASFSSVIQAAASAVETGNSSVTLVLSDSAISCSHGSIALSSGSLRSSYAMPVACSFRDGPLSGQTDLEFSYDGSLKLRVN